MCNDLNDTVFCKVRADASVQINKGGARRDYVGVTHVASITFEEAMA